jgi:hypothetical protein
MMRRLFLVFCLILSSCATKLTIQDCSKLVKGKNKKEAVSCIIKHRLRSQKYWQDKLNLPLSKKVYLANQELRDYLYMENKILGYTDKPRVVGKDLNYMVPLVQKVLDGLPSIIKDKLDNRFAGIALLENFGGTGYTTTIQNTALKIMGSYILLDPRNLQRKANEWNDWKENSPFKPGAFKLITQLQKKEKNTIEKAVEYILLHEIGHVFANNYTLTEPWEDTIEFARYYGKPDYAKLSWNKDKKKYTPKDKIRDLDKVLYYFGAKLDSEAMVNVYEDLEKSSFPTLYAATYIGDDFADSFVNYIHVNILKNPWKIEILKEGKVVKIINHCWNKPRCQAKRKYFQKLLK